MIATEEDDLVAQDYLARIFHAIQPDNFDGKAIPGDAPDGDLSDAEWDMWNRAREVFWAQYPEAEPFRNYIVQEYPTRLWKTEEMTDAHREYRAAIGLRDEFQQIPKYRGLSLDDGKFIDEVRSIASRAGAEIRFLAAQQGRLDVTIPRRMNWVLTLNALQQSGKDFTPHELQLLQVAMLLDLNPRMSQGMLSSARAQFLIDNPLVSEWYPTSFQAAGLGQQEVAILGLAQAPGGTPLEQRVGQFNLPLQQVGIQPLAGVAQ